METPSSTRRVTRSQTSASANRISTFNSENGLTKSRKNPATTKKQQDRFALIDITNDSPIVGLAMGNFETPSSAMSKKMGVTSSREKPENNTPGSGEALLRGQVMKTLLQKVEDEAQRNDLASLAPSPVEDKCVISQMVTDFSEGKEEEDVSELDNSMMVTRSLLLDFSEKSEVSYSSECSSEVTFQGTDSESGKGKSTSEDDDASIWSIQVNASTKDDDEEEGLEEEEVEEEEEFEEADSELVDELCEAVSKISVNGGVKTMTKFSGKHTRFCYNSDDEIEGEEEVGGSSGNDESSSAGGALRLKGLPTPKGKHLRFPEEEEIMDTN